MRPAFVLPWLLVGAGLTGGLVALLAPNLARVLGLPDPGPLVNAGLPAATVLAFGATAACVANLLEAAVLSPGTPDGDGTVSVAGYRGLRAARWWALAQTVTSALVALLVVAENAGIRPERLPGEPGALLVGLQRIEPATGWLLSAVVAAGVAVFAGVVLTWRGAVALLLLAMAGPLCIALTSATNAQRSHDIAGMAQAGYRTALLLWLASSLCVALGARPLSPARLRRHAAIARWCLPLVVGTSVVLWAYAVPPARLFDSGYGRLVLASAGLLAALAVISPALRQWGDRPRRLEPLLLGALAATGVALGRLVPPADSGYTASRQVYLLGYDLPGQFTALDLVIRWRPNLVFASLAVVAAAGYLAGVRRLRRAGETWRTGYTVAWLIGCVLLLVATSSGLGTYGPAVFSVHMVTHMLLGGAIPALLVLGHGRTLLLRATAPPLRRRLASLEQASVVRLAGNPVVALISLAAVLLLLYPTGLFAMALSEHWAHLLINFAYLLTGLALFWSILGRGAGRELPPIAALVVLFAAMAVHAGFSAWLLGQPTPVGGVFYESLHAPFLPDPMADQRLGAILGWALGEVPIIIALLALVRRWSRDDREPENVTDTTPARERELAATNR